MTMEDYIVDDHISFFSALGKEHKAARAILLELKEHLSALRDGEDFTPKLTAKGKRTSKDLKNSKKRKNERQGGGSNKRRKARYVELVFWFFSFRPFD
jgi:hypothetical protein